MRVAVAGTGSFAKHFIDEPAAGHEVVVLTRSHKDFLDGKKGVVEQRITDYSSVPQLVELLKDCDTLVSIIFDIQQPSAEIHLTLLEACKQSPKCQRFIPAEYGGNSEDFPEDAESMDQRNVPLKKALKAQNDVEWTFISLGWVMDYIVPSANRNHPNLGPFNPARSGSAHHDHPRLGQRRLLDDQCTRRDQGDRGAFENQEQVAPVHLHPGHGNDVVQLAELVKTSGGVSDLKVSFESGREIKEALEKKELMQSAMLAEFKMLVPSGKCTLNQEKVKRDRAEHFPNVHLRTAQKLLDAVKEDAKGTI